MNELTTGILVKFAVMNTDFSMEEVLREKTVGKLLADVEKDQTKLIIKVGDQERTLNVLGIAFTSWKSAFIKTENALYYLEAHPQEARVLKINFTN